MRYAEVSVNSPVAQRRTFSYSIPSNLRVEVGQAVWVPFGVRVLQGIILEVSPSPAVEKTRDIIDVIEPELILPQSRIALARWISEYYLSPLFDAVSLMLPPGYERKALTFVSVSDQSADISSLTGDQKLVFDYVAAHDNVDLRKIDVAGKRKTPAVVSQLVKMGLLARSYRIEPVKVQPRIELFLSLSVASEEARKNAEGLRKRGFTKQSVLLEYLASQSLPVSWKEVRANVDVDRTVVNALARKQLINLDSREVRRDPYSAANFALSAALSLTPEQTAAVDAIKASLQPVAGNHNAEVFLLHGVTGSGKTEVYLQALAEAVRQGKRGIVLVPEISLTPQTIERFASRFPGRVAVLHSQLSLGEQYDEWHRIQRGQVDVVIGPRSALFAPQPDLGLIVIDEEHEWTYKQQDKSPHYHARSVALKLAELTGAVAVLGSATPDVADYYLAQTGVYRQLKLPGRVVPYPGASLPDVTVVDMRVELKAGNLSLFSRALAQAVNEAIAEQKQVILFLNRRGGATFIQCRSCGYVMRCRRCEVPLTYHPAENILTCHQCNYKTPVPHVCPKCSSRNIKFLGTGTQKLEQEVAFTFPRARHLRWDSDSARTKSSYEEILRRFLNHEADILIGTQLVAKGLDIPAVGLVGVINADTALNLPDFRAGERIFQLLSQVAGRAGRGKWGGRVIIQTFSPDHYAIKAAAAHDYEAFYNKEIEYRRQLQQPPFKQLALLRYYHLNDALCGREAERMKTLLINEMDRRGISGISLIGPAPSFIHRLRGRFRWQIILRGSNLAEFLSDISFPQGWTVDIDSMSLIQ
jgi:primosomal protein N' (replication factor Y)